MFHFSRFNSDLSENEFGTSIELNAYVGSSNTYEFPCNGYLFVKSPDSGSKVRVVVLDANGRDENLAIEPSLGGNRHALFVKKGMKMYNTIAAHNSSYVSFVPLQ